MHAHFQQYPGFCSNLYAIAKFSNARNGIKIKLYVCFCIWNFYELFYEQIVQKLINQAVVDFYN